VNDPSFGQNPKSLKMIVKISTPGHLFEINHENPQYFWENDPLFSKLFLS
jgi:hypothetical protein